MCVAREQSKYEPRKYEHSTIGRLLDGTEIDLAQMSELTTPRRRESLLPFHDRTVAWKEVTTRWNGFWTKLMLRKPIDMPILSVYLSIACTTVPSAIGLAYCTKTEALPRWALHLWGVAHIVMTLVGQAPGFILGLHYSSHVRIWQKGYEWMDGIVHHLYCALFGIPCGAYYCHHIIMHHKEDNQLNYDASTTMPYQRDSWLHLLAYCLRYIVGIWVELPLVLTLRERRLEALKLFCTGTGYVAAIVVGMQRLPLATTYVLLLPFIIISFALMRGNQLQHLWVSPDDPTCDFKLSYDICNTWFNEETFNDAFHIEHHVSPNTHWAELPHKFLSLLPKHAEKDSFIFNNIHPDQVHWLVYTGQLEKLADHYVHVGQPSGTSKEKLVTEMRRRLAPIYTQHRSTHKAKLS